MKTKLRTIVDQILIVFLVVIILLPITPLGYHQILEMIALRVLIVIFSFESVRRILYDAIASGLISFPSFFFAYIVSTTLCKENLIAWVILFVSGYPAFFSLFLMLFWFIDANWPNKITGNTLVATIGRRHIRISPNTLDYYFLIQDQLN